MKLHIQTADGWMPVNRMAQTIAERITADDMEAKAIANLHNARQMPEWTDKERRDRHHAIMSAYSEIFAADAYRKGVREVQYHD